MIEPRAIRTTIVLDRVEGDASGNNDRQRTELARMTIDEAERFSERLESAIEEAVNARAAERKARIAQARAEREACRLKIRALSEEIDALEGGDVAEHPAPPNDLPSIAASTVDHMWAEIEAVRAAERKAAGVTIAAAPPATMTEDELMNGLEADGFSVAAPMVLTPNATVMVGVIESAPVTAASARLGDDPEMPDFLRRTA